jgi:hypothetical protein
MFDRHALNVDDLTISHELESVHTLLCVLTFACHESLQAVNGSVPRINAAVAIIKCGTCLSDNGVR